MKPFEIVRVLEKCSLISPWRRDETLKRWRWAIDSYVAGYIPKDRLDEEKASFLRVAEDLIAEQSFLDYLAQPARPLTATEQERKEQWLRVEAQRATRLELQRQRRRLREGHQTLTAIRRLLAHGVRSSLVLASEPGTSSQT